jgi:hypothetical protein
LSFAEQADRLNGGVTGEEPQQLSPDESRRTQYPDSSFHAHHMHFYA